jgi:hypothetical protein
MLPLMLLRSLGISAICAAAVAPVGVEAAGTSFDPRIVTVGEAREQLKAMPITDRPYRPLHVYGNTVRRRNQRNQAGMRPSGAIR